MNSILDNLHIRAEVATAHEEVFTEHFTVHGIYFGQGDPEHGGQHWNFTRSLGDEDEGRVCTVKEIQAVTVYGGVTKFEMTRTGVICEFDDDTAVHTGVRRLTIAYQVDDAGWRDLQIQARLIFTGLPCFELVPCVASRPLTGGMREQRSVADIAGPWAEPDVNSSLIERCRANWSVPVGEITNYVLATFIRQKIALDLVVPEAKRRIASGYIDDTEILDDELAIAIALI